MSWITRELSFSFWFSVSEAELFRLLVGIDEARREIVCGLVDTLGESPFYLSSSFRPVHKVLSSTPIVPF